MKGSSIAIKARLPNGYKELYEVSKRCKLDYGLNRALQQQVTAIRRGELRQHGEDKLQVKQSVYGNRGRWSAEQLRKLARLVYEGKKPGVENMGEWLSIELELIFPRRESETQFVTFCRTKGYSKLITIKEDGSIHPTEDRDNRDCDCSGDDDGNCIDDCNTQRDSRQYGREIVVTMKQGDWDFLSDVCAKLLELGAYVNKSCGTHVHFDMRQHTARQVTTFGKRIARAVPALKLLLPKSRQDNQFCYTPINHHKRGSRYAFVNLQSYSKHATLEVRGHSGTLDAEKIKNWILLIKRIMEVRCTKPVVSVGELIGTYRLNRELADYVAKRYAKFNVMPQKSGDDISNDQESA